MVTLFTVKNERIIILIPSLLLGLDVKSNAVNNNEYECFLTKLCDCCLPETKAGQKIRKKVLRSNIDCGCSKSCCYLLEREKSRRDKDEVLKLP